jgi:hypothetical protein
MYTEVNPQYIWRIFRKRTRSSRRTYTPKASIDLNTLVQQHPEDSAFGNLLEAQPSSHGIVRILKSCLYAGISGSANMESPSIGTLVSRS